jgi:hypothetical protein
MQHRSHPSHGIMNAAFTLTRHLRLILGATILFIAACVQAVELAETPKVQVDSTTATIVWKTDVDCGTRLNFGTSADALKQRREGPVSSTHTVTIDSLSPGTTYYFSVGSARQKLATGTFTTTGTSSPSAAPTPSVPTKATPRSLPPIPAVAPAPPPTRQTWGNLQSLVDHYERHGPDFKSTSPDDYAARAWTFLQQAKANAWPMKLDDSDGTLRVWNGQTGSFAAYDRNGKTKTYFKPGSPTYWQRQPGSPIKPSQLPFK